MPMLDQGSTGAQAVAAARAVQKLELTLPSEESPDFNFSEALQCIGKPKLRLWVPAPPVGSTGTAVKLQGSCSNEGGVPEWFDLTTPIGLVVGTPAIVEVDFPCTFIRAAFQPPALTTFDIEAFLGAYAT